MERGGTESFVEELSEAVGETRVGWMRRESIEGDASVDLGAWSDDDRRGRESGKRVRGRFDGDGGEMK